MGITTEQVKKTIEKLCSVIIQNEVNFCDLDSVAGDGDFGMSLAKGFREVQRQIADIDGSSIQKFLRGCAMIIAEYCGGASGPIWSSGFQAASSAAKGKETLELSDVAELFRAAVNGIQKRGGAAQGDKTLLDALIPAVEAIENAAQSGASLEQAFEEAAAQAEAGAEATKEMVASKGRATYVGERSLNHPDAGAMAIAIIFKALL